MTNKTSDQKNYRRFETKNINCEGFRTLLILLIWLKNCSRAFQHKGEKGACKAFCSGRLVKEKFYRLTWKQKPVESEWRGTKWATPGGQRRIFFEATTTTSRIRLRFGLRSDETSIFHFLKSCFFPGYKKNFKNAFLQFEQDWKNSEKRQQLRIHQFYLYTKHNLTGFLPFFSVSKKKVYLFSSSFHVFVLFCFSAKRPK